MSIFSVKTFKEDNEYWFCLVHNGSEVKLSNNFPLWYCVDHEGFLTKVSENPFDDSIFKVIYHRYSYINNVSDNNIFSILNSNIKTIYSKKPRRAINWDINGEVSVVIADSFYYEYSNGRCTKIVDILYKDEKIYVNDHTIRLEIDSDDTYLEIDIDLNKTNINYEYFSESEKKRIRRLMKQRPFDIDCYEKDPFMCGKKEGNGIFTIELGETYQFEIDHEIDQVILL